MEVFRSGQDPMFCFCNPTPDGIHIPNTKQSFSSSVGSWRVLIMELPEKFESAISDPHKWVCMFSHDRFLQEIQPRRRRGKAYLIFTMLVCMHFGPPPFQNALLKFARKLDSLLRIETVHQ